MELNHPQTKYSASLFAEIIASKRAEAYLNLAGLF